MNTEKAYNYSVIIAPMDREPITVNFDAAWSALDYAKATITGVTEDNVTVVIHKTRKEEGEQNDI